MRLLVRPHAPVDLGKLRDDYLLLRRELAWQLRSRLVVSIAAYRRAGLLGARIPR